MTTHDQQPDTFAWRAAPSHLKTRRQLRAMGLRPNGQDPAALMVREATGRRRRRLWAHLFDTRTAAPKRSATPAQMEAVAKAVRARQIRAAERRGISVEELLQESDPGPGWNTGPTTEEEKPMSEHTDTRVIDDQDPATQSRLGQATGPGQRLAHLHAVLAVNRARYDREQLAGLRRAAGRAHRELEQNDQDPERQESARTSAAALAELRAELGQRAARWQGTVPWHRSREAFPQVLADALIWREEDDKSREMVDQLVEHYRSGWGVVIDTDTLTVGIDPDFDPEPVQRFDEAAALWSRETAALDIVSAAPLTATAKDAALHALNNWTASWNVEGGSHTYVETRAQRREQLDRELNTLLSESDRPRVEFVVDYLSGEVAGVDLLDTPTLVDPGEEVRGRIPQLLESFADERLSPQGMAAEISVMTAADQEKVRDVGRAILAGHNPDLEVWPGYVNRDQVLDELRQYATDAAEQLEIADWMAEGDMSGESPEMFGVNDENEARLLRMDETRHRLHGIATNPAQNGLTAVERAQLEATLADIDTGRIRGEEALPELMWADDRTRAQIDEERQFETGSRIGRETRLSIDALVAGTGRNLDETQQKTLSQAVAGIGDAISSVATGPGLETLDMQRRRYSEKIQGLGEALTRAGIDPDTKQRVREVVDSNARTAGQFGRTATDRDQRWKARTEQVVSTRNDGIAQRQAAAAGRAPRQGRNCATRPDRAAQPSTPAPARAAGRRQLHSDLGR